MSSTNDAAKTLRRFQILGLGELLWDLLPAGRLLGGAPANFAYHAHALGAEARVVSRVGNDPLGHEACRQLEGLGVSIDCVETDPTLPTGTASIELSADGQAQFCVQENVAWDALSGAPAAWRAISVADAVCFGTLGQRSEPAGSTIRELVAATPRTALRILDVNLRQHYFSRQRIEESLALANVLKVNDTELARLAAMWELTGDTRSQIRQLAGRYGLNVVALTRGARGSLLFRVGQWSEHPGTSTEVVDTVGAGDSFTAAMALGLLAGWDLDQVSLRANEVAAYVCSCPGGTPALAPRLGQAFECVRATAPRPSAVFHGKPVGVLRGQVTALGSWKS